MIVKNGEIIAIGKVKHDDTLSGTGISDDKLGGLMAFLGLGGQEFSTEKRTSYEVREYKELLENLEKKAQSMGINTREELKKKQQLEALLQQLGVR